MELKDIIKAAEEAGVDSGVVTAIKALDNSAEVERLKKAVEDSEGKAKGILQDKKKFKERAEKAEGDLQKIADAKLPDDEKHAKQLQELQDKLDQQQKDGEKREADYAKAARDAKVSDLTTSVKWASGVPAETAKGIVKAALSGVEDLSDKTKVDEILNNVRESHKSFIAADTASGSGGKQSGGEGGSGGDDKQPTIAENQKAIWRDK